MNAAANENTLRAATRLEIGAKRRRVADYSDEVLICEHDRAWRDAFQVLGHWSPEREALVAGLCMEMQRRGLVAA